MIFYKIINKIEEIKSILCDCQNMDTLQSYNNIEQELQKAFMNMKNSFDLGDEIQGELC
jgi:hypothetical protein